MAADSELDLRRFRAELGESATAGISDENLVKFLRWKHDMARAVTRFHAFTEWQSGAGSYSCIPKPLRVTEDPMLHKILASGTIICPDGMYDKLGRKVLMGRLRFNNFSDGRRPEDLVRMLLYNVEFALRDPEIQESGVVVFHDMRDVGPSNLSLAVPKLILSALIGHYPVKLKGIYVLNAPWFFRNVMLPMVKVMFPAKLQQRIFILSDVSELHELIDRDSLLVEHGGPKTHDQEAWLAARVAEERSGSAPQLLADVRTLMAEGR